jgi:hypothetical protein
LGSACSRSSVAGGGCLSAQPASAIAIEDHDLARCRQMAYVALQIHLRLLPLGRRGQRHDAEDARTDALGDRLDRPTLAGAVAALEDDAHLEAGVLDPFLQSHELDVQAFHDLRVFLVRQAAIALIDRRVFTRLGQAIDIVVLRRFLCFPVLFVLCHRLDPGS